MARKRRKPEEIVTKLRQVEALHGQGRTMLDAIRQIGVTEVTYYRRRKQYGGMSAEQLKRLSAHCGAATRRGLGCERQARRTIMATRGSEGPRKTAQA